MKKAAIASIAVVCAAVLAVYDREETQNKVSPMVAEAQEEVENEEEEAIKDPLVPDIDTSVLIESGARIAVVSKCSKGQFWETVQKGMSEAIDAVNAAYQLEKGEKVTMTFEGPDDERDVETQINTLDAVIAENPAVVCLSAGDMESCQAQLEAARENGIPVVVFDSNVADMQLVDAFRSTDNINMGEIAAEKLAQAMDGQGKVIVFSAQAKTSTVKDRVEGFQSKMKEYEDIRIVDIIYEDQVEDMAAAMQEALEKYPDLAGVYCTNADTSEMYLDLEKDEERAIAMVGTDATKRQQEAVKNGEEAGVVSQDPYAMGYHTILAAVILTQEENRASVEKELLLEPKWLDAAAMEDPQYSGYIY